MCNSGRIRPRGAHVPTSVAVLLLLVLGGCSCAAAGATPNPAGTADHRVAGRAGVVPGFLDRAEIVRDPGEPASFRMVLGKDLPTPGWGLRVERFEPFDAAGIAVVHLVRVPPPPGSLYVQVITPRDVEVDLGSLAVGRYLVDVRVRTAGRDDEVRADALVVAAFER